MTDKPFTAWLGAANELIDIVPALAEYTDAVTLAHALAELSDAGWIVDPDEYDWMCNEYASQLEQVERATDALVAVQGGAQ